jgi:uncharacterized protein with HEPN domain
VPNFPRLSPHIICTKAGIPTLRPVGKLSAKVQPAAAAIPEFSAGLDAAGYRANPLIRSAVERQFEIIGEALNRRSKEAPDLANLVPNSGRSWAFAMCRSTAIRRLTTDGWEIVTTLLPSLRATVTALLTEPGSPDA